MSQTVILPLPSVFLAGRFEQGTSRAWVLVTWLGAVLSYCKTQESLRRWVEGLVAALGSTSTSTSTSTITLEERVAAELAAAEALGVPNAAALAIPLAAALAPASGALVRAAHEAAALLEAQSAALLAAQAAQIPAAKSAEALKLSLLLLTRALLFNQKITLGGGRQDLVSRTRIPIATLANMFFETVQLKPNKEMFWDWLLPILRGQKQILAAKVCPAELDKAMSQLLSPLMSFLEAALRSTLEGMLAHAGCLGFGPLGELWPIKLSNEYFELEFTMQNNGGVPPEVLQAYAVPPGTRPHQIPDFLDYFEDYCLRPGKWVEIIDNAHKLIKSITRDCPHGPRWGLWAGGFSGPTPCADCAAEKIPRPPKWNAID